MAHFYQHASEHRGSNSDHLVRGDTVTPSWEDNKNVDQYANVHGGNYDYGSGINRFLGIDNTTDHTAAGKALGVKKSLF